MSDRKPKFDVVESVTGSFYYHLRSIGAKGRALCGYHVMNTSIPHEAWGTQTHLRERWCQKCQGLAYERLAKSLDDRDCLGEDGDQSGSKRGSAANYAR